MKHSEKVNRVVFNGDFVEKNPCRLRDSNPRPSDSVLASTGLWPLVVPKLVATPLGGH